MNDHHTETQTDPEMKKPFARPWLKLFARTFLYLGGLCIVLIVGGVSILQTRPGKEAVIKLIEKSIADQTPFVCRIGGLSGSLISRFAISGLDVRDARTGGQIFSADRIDVSYSIPMLLGRVLWVNRLTLTGASVHLLQAKDGRWNFEMPSPDKAPESSATVPEAAPAPETSPFTVSIRRFNMADSDVTLVWQMDDGEVVHRFTGIECEARLHVGDTLETKIRHLAVRMDFPDIDLRGLSGYAVFDFENSRLDVHSVRIQGERSDFTVAGRLNFPEEGPDPLVMDLHADINAMSLGEFGRAFPVEMPDADIVSGNLSVKGPIARMDCRLDLRMDDCHLMSQGLVTLDDANDVGLDIFGKTTGLDLAALPALGLSEFPSAINADFSLVWQRIGMPAQTGKIIMDVDPSRFRGRPVADAHLEVSIAGADLVFDDIDLRTPSGVVAGTGILAGFMDGGADNRIQFAADVSDLNPGDFLKDSRFAGTLNGAVESAILIPKTFEAKDITAEAVCRIGPSRLMDMEIVSADIDAAWADDAVRFRRCDLETAMGGASLTGIASISDETCRVTARVTLPDIAVIRPFVPDFPDGGLLSGSLALSAEINGQWASPDIKADVKGENIVFGEVSTETLSAAGKWRGNPSEFSFSGEFGANNLRVSHLLIPEMAVKGSGTRASVQADIDLYGGGKEHLMLSGRIGQWLSPVKAVAIQKLVLEASGQPPLSNRETIELSISGDRIQVDSLHLDSGNASLAINGWADLNPPAKVSAAAVLKDFNLQRIAGFYEGGAKIHGRLSSDIAVSGLLGDPVIQMTASAQDAVYDDFPAADLSASLGYENSRLTITGSGLRKGDKFLDVSGSGAVQLAFYPFSFAPLPESLSAAVHLERVDISEILEHVLPEAPVQGRLSSDIQLSGRLESPVIDMQVSIKEAAFNTFSLPEAAASIVYKDSQATVAASADHEGKKLLDADGSAQLALSLYPFAFEPRPGGLDMDIRLDQADISWISEIIKHPEYGISGILDGKAAVSGDFSNPDITGRIYLKQGELTLKKQGLVYETLTADIGFSGDAITLSDLTVKGDKEGSLRLSGGLTHDHFRPRTFDLRAVGNQLYVPFHSGVDARINPDLTLSGTWAAPVLTGKITVPEGRVNLERFLAKQVSEIKIVAPVSDENGLLRVPETEPEPLAFIDPLAADVSVVVPKDFWFRGKDEYIEIKGNIQLKKEPRKPFVLYGSVVPVRGTYRFRGRIFQITDGELTFVGQEDVNPFINIEAETEIGQVTIIIRLSGTFERLNLALDSDPVMDPSDIISYLVFGRGPNDLSEKESFQAEEAALSFTGQIAADRLRDIIGDTLGIDYLNISAGSGGLRQGSLTMGKYVLPRVFVTFRQGFDETVSRKLEVTYEINKNFDLETQIDSERTSALDLIWKYDF